MGTEKIYLVIEAHWEYNDENYNKAGSRHGVSDVGTHKRAFRKKVDAVAEAQRLSIKEIKGTNIAEYASDGVGSILADGKEEAFRKLLGIDPEDDRDLDRLDYKTFEIPTNITDAKAAAILDCLSIGWYGVVELDIEG